MRHPCPFAHFILTQTAVGRKRMPAMLWEIMQRTLSGKRTNICKHSSFRRPSARICRQMSRGGPSRNPSDLRRRKSRLPRSVGHSFSLVVNSLTALPDDLLLRLDFRDPDPKVIDMSPIGGVVSTLTEGKIYCLSADKVRTDCRLNSFVLD